MRIVLFGSGGVGGYFGGRLAAAGADVTFIARGAHLEALRTRGLRIESPKGDVHVPRVHATDDPASIGPADVVLFAVKLYDTDAAAARLSPLVGPDTVVIPVQNGVDSVDALSRIVGAPHVAGGSAYVAAVISEPGVIRHTAMDHLIFGESEPHALGAPGALPRRVPAGRLPGDAQRRHQRGHLVEVHATLRLQRHDRRSRDRRSASCATIPISSR